jgi:hypothetical protein
MARLVELMGRHLFWLWGRSQAIAWFALAAVIHTAAFSHRDVDDVVSFVAGFIASCIALGGGYVVTKACLEHAREVNREFRGDD